MEKKNYYLIWRVGEESPAESPVLNRDGMSLNEAENLAARCRAEGETVEVLTFCESPYWRLAWENNG